MKELSYRATPRNKNAIIAFLISFLLSALGFVAYSLVDRYRGIVGLVAMMLLVTAILFYTKYISPVFFYDLYLDGSDNSVFIVRRVVGRRQSTFCRVSLSDVVSVTKESRAEYKAHKTPTGFLKYIYAPTLFPKEVYRLTVRGRYEKAEVVIEATEEFAEAIKEYANEARILRAEDDEE